MQCTPGLLNKKPAEYTSSPSPVVELERGQNVLENKPSISATRLPYVPFHNQIKRNIYFLHKSTHPNPPNTTWLEDMINLIQL